MKKGKALIENELILAIDFDGTITTEPDIGKELVLQDNCADVLCRLKDDGVRLILWTCRTGAHLDEALEFLGNHGLLGVFDTINEQLPEVIEKYSPDVARKIGADFYFDDKNVMGEIDWLALEKYVYGEELSNVC